MIEKLKDTKELRVAMPSLTPLQSRYSPKDIEREILSYWENQEVYKKLKEVNSTKSPNFLFIDGPPYTSSPIPHIGTVWNKTLKDAILRYMRLMGRRVWDQPGYDCHGLPIEVAMERRIGVNKKSDIETKIGVENFIKMCASFAKENADGLTANFKDIGIFMDWQKPYYTMDNEYISNSWHFVKRAYERGLLERGYDVLHWCPRCETTLADYEVSEYAKIEDPSIYVKFPVEGEKNKFLLIWTTTPWTIPANVFVMVNPEEDYSDVQVGSEVYVIARKRVEAVMTEAKISKYSIVRTYKGRTLLGLSYTHPLQGLVPAQEGVVHVVADGHGAVTMEEGTGLVHSAPGHGDVDFAVGKEFGAKVLMLVNDSGNFSEDAGPYAGINVREASQLVIKDLKDRNMLLHAGKISHSYPICWRCKTPLILRATTQWFFRVTRMKDKILSEIDRVNWVPEWGRSRIYNMSTELRDWVVSRQRYWGTPLPIWTCKKCGTITVVGSKEELSRLSLNGVPDNLHRPWIDKVIVRCQKCGGEAERSPDVADVWFDSGVAFLSSLGKEKWKEIGPADLVLEGHDQLRGWFFSLLRSGVILEDRAPYKAVLVHGFMLDETGREMHKSMGNYVQPSEVIEKYSRDILRAWLLRNLTWEDARFSWKSFDVVKRDLQVVWNTFVFASTYMSMDNFHVSSASIERARSNMTVEDRWLISRYNSMLLSIMNSMKDFKVHEMAESLFNFLIEDVSRFYLKITRKRAWTEEMTPDKEAFYTTLYRVLRGWLVLVSAVIPFTSEKIYLNVFPDHKVSVSMEEADKPQESLIDKRLEEAVELVKETYTLGANARAKANVKLRWPLRKAYVFVRREDDLEKLNSVREMLRSLLNVKDVVVEDISRITDISQVKAVPIRATIGRDFRSLAPRIVEFIEKNSPAVGRSIAEGGLYRVSIDGQEVVLNSSHVKIEREVSKDYIYAEGKTLILALDKELSSEEREEGITRDIVRRIQFMRKTLNMDISSFINIVIYADEETTQILQRYKDYISNETRASTIVFENVEKAPQGEQKIEGRFMVREWEVEGERIVISIERKT